MIGGAGIRCSFCRDLHATTTIDAPHEEHPREEGHEEPDDCGSFVHLISSPLIAARRHRRLRTLMWYRPPQKRAHEPKTVELGVRAAPLAGSTAGQSQTD
jgi:hypothetical protein